MAAITPDISDKSHPVLGMLHESRLQRVTRCRSGMFRRTGAHRIAAIAFESELGMTITDALRHAAPSAGLA
jgi:hypothetical protein